MKVTLKHKKQQTVEQAAMILANWLRPHLAQLMNFAAPLVGKVRDFYLQEMLIKLPRDSKRIAQVKNLMKEYFSQLLIEKQFRSVIIVPDVDWCSNATG